MPLTAAAAAAAGAVPALADGGQEASLTVVERAASALAAAGRRRRRDSVHDLVEAAGRVLDASCACRELLLALRRQPRGSRGGPGAVASKA